MRDRTSTTGEVMAYVRRWMPIASWLPAFPRSSLRPELIAAVTSWGVMVPVALAYAEVAGVPPEVGLVTAFAGLTGYALFATSRELRVTTSSTMAVMSASVVAPIAAGDPAAYLALTAALALIVGVILVAAGLVRVGFISEFLAKPAVTGFITGLAIVVVIGQLPKILGVTGGGVSTPEKVVTLIEQLPDTAPATLAVGLVTLAIIFGSRLVSRRIPGPLIALVVGLLATSLLDLQAKGVTVVGQVATGVPMPGLPAVPVTDAALLTAGALGIVFLAAGESIGAGRAFAAKHRYDVDADQELIALGAGNLASGLFGGFVVDASLSQSATAESAGARSQLGALLTAALVLATALLLAPLFEQLPEAVLAGIVIASVIGLIDLAEFRRYASWRRTDLLIALVAFAGVVLTTVLIGLVIAVVLSLALLLYRASRPYVAVLGRIGTGSGFADIERGDDRRPIPGLLILRIDAPLYFFNVNVARDEILARLSSTRPPPRVVLADIGATADLDVTTIDTLTRLIEDLADRDVQLWLAHVKGPVRDRMHRTGFIDLIGAQHLHRSTADAVAVFEATPRPVRVAADPGTRDREAPNEPGAPNGPDTPDGPDAHNDPAGTNGPPAPNDPAGTSELAAPTDRGPTTDPSPG
jgi:SulP family sulfate permease